MPGDAVALHQAEKIRRRVARQRRLCKVLIRREKVRGRGVHVGEVAAPAAGDENLRAGTVVALQHGHRAAPPSGLDGAHQSGGPGTQNEYIRAADHPARSRQFSAKSFILNTSNPRNRGIYASFPRPLRPIGTLPLYSIAPFGPAGGEERSIPRIHNSIS